MLIDIYRQAYFNRCFELKVAAAHKQGLIKAPIYLSVGTEHIPAAIADISKDWLIFPQHRCHSWLLSFGADPTLVAKELLGHSDGLGRGYQGSASLGDVKLGIYSHDGHLGSNLPIAAGAAHATGKPTIVHIGDAACEESLDMLGYIATHKLPVLVIVEDNDLSILTKTTTRRCWKIHEVARSLGMVTDDIVDYPMGIRHRTLACWNKWKKGEQFGGCLLNIQCNRFCWHCGNVIEIDSHKDKLVWLKSWLISDWDNWEEEEEQIDKLQLKIQQQVDDIWNPLIGEE